MVTSTLPKSEQGGIVETINCFRLLSNVKNTRFFFLQIVWPSQNIWTLRKLLKNNFNTYFRLWLHCKISFGMNLNNGIGIRKKASDLFGQYEASYSMKVCPLRWWMHFKIKLNYFLTFAQEFKSDQIKSNQKFTLPYVKISLWL